MTAICSNVIAVHCNLGGRQPGAAVERLVEFSPALDWADNIWMGVSVERREYAFRKLRQPYQVQQVGLGCELHQEVHIALPRRPAMLRSTGDWGLPRTGLQLRTQHSKLITALITVLIPSVKACSASSAVSR